jgi:cyclophilin family peptidyl-prolyl cis-trans isomerase/Flp pilus assembly protein TadD
MRTRVSVFCDKVIEAGWLAAAIIVPLFFNIYSQRVFEPDKLSLLRSIAWVMSAAWLVRVAEDWRAGRHAEEQPLPLWRRIYKTPMVLPTLLLVVVYLLGTVTSVAWKVSLLGSYQRLQGTYTTLSYIVIFFLILDGLRTKRQLNRLITVVVLVSFPIAMYGLIQHFGLDPLPWGGNVTSRVASNMGNAIFVAAYLIMVVPLTLSRLLENWSDTADGFETRDVLLGVVAFVLLVAALLIGMLVRRGETAVWIRWAALLVGVGLQVPIYLLSPAERRPRVLAVSLPLTFAFLVGFSWILELFFPPEVGATASRYFWLGLGASLIFVVAMVAFAYYLRKPVARLLLLSGYFIILIAQILCIFYTQSRGPLLGLLGGVSAYFALMGIIKRRIWLPWLMTGGALAIVVFFVAFNTLDLPVIEKLRETPYVGRLGKVLQTEEGTGKVRVLIWEGVTNMMDWHPPLEWPGQEGGTDALNVVRPFIGYGPESMYVAYNRFYPPDLAHYEKRNASPDRSHNETFDAWVITGGVGFVVYMLVFTSVLYFGLKWLGLIQERWQRLAFVGLWTAGGLVGAIAAWAWRGPVYVGVGIPGGVMVGLGLYVFIEVILGTFRSQAHQFVGRRYSLWILALFSAIVAHFVEIHFGIAIAATRTLFWIYTGMLVVMGTRLATLPAEEEVPDAAAVALAKEQPSRSRRRRRRGGAAAPLARREQAGDRQWQGSLLTWSLLTVLILGTILFNSVTIQPDNPGVLGTIWNSLTQSRGNPSLVMLVLFMSTWGMVGLMALSDLSTRSESADKEPGDWLAAIGIFVLVVFAGTLTFALIHATQLKPITISSVDAPNPLADTITVYYVFAFLVVVAVALALAVLSRSGRLTMPWHWAGELGDFGVVALSLALALVVGVMIFATNVSIVRADILYKQGLSAEKAGQWDGAIYFYEKAIETARDQDFYYLFLGRAYMEKARSLQGEQRELLFQRSEQALQQARELAPLNTDHSANLARLYRTWGGSSQGDKRIELLNKSLIYYADATSLSPHNAQLFNEWGQSYLALGNADRALEKYQHSLSLDSQYLQTYLLLGELYMSQKRWQEAADIYQQAVALSPGSVEAYSAIGYVATQMGDLEAAQKAYLKAVELQPRNFNHRKNLAILYQQMGQTDEAIVQATEALNLAPENQKQALQNFLAELRQAQSSLSPEDAQQVQQWLTEGSAQMQAQDWEAAASTYEQVLALDANNPQAHSALAYIYAQEGKVDEAIDENLTVVSLVPNDYNSYKNLALLYQQKGDVDQAISAAGQALALAPDSDKQALEAFLAQLKQSQGEAPTPAEPGARAGDLPPDQRNDMYSAAPAMTLDPGKSYQATIVTAKGNIVVDLNAAEAPQTVNNFVYLARQGFYDDLTFHRVENSAGFSLIQGGDPTGTGRGGPGYTVPAEIGLPHDAGAIAMARLGDQVNPERASSGSQFYICLDPIHQLDGAYTVFGYVVEGLDVAKKIAVDDKILTIVITEK